MLKSKAVFYSQKINLLRTIIPKKRTIFHSTEKYSFEKRKYLAFNTHDVLAVISNVEEYPKFISWISSAKIITNSEKFNDTKKVRTFSAELGVQFMNIHSKYTSVVTVSPYSVEAIGVEDEVLKFLNSKWQCIPDPIKGTNIVFSVDFQFKSALHDTLARQFFPSASQTLIDSFENRCIELYSSPK